MVVDGTVRREWRDERREAEARMTEERLGPRWTDGREEKQARRRENAGENWWRSDALQGCGMSRAGCKLIPRSWQCLSKAISSPSE